MKIPMLHLLVRLVVALSLFIGTMAFETGHTHASPAGIGVEEPHRDQPSHSKASCHTGLRCNALSMADSLVLPARMTGARRLSPVLRSRPGSSHILRIATPPPRLLV